MQRRFPGKTWWSGNKTLLQFGINGFLMHALWNYIPPFGSFNKNTSLLFNSTHRTLHNSSMLSLFRKMFRELETGHHNFLPYLSQFSVRQIPSFRRNQKSAELCRLRSLSFNIAWLKMSVLVPRRSNASCAVDRGHVSVSWEAFRLSDPLSQECYHVYKYLVTVRKGEQSCRGTAAMVIVTSSHRSSFLSRQKTLPFRLSSFHSGQTFWETQLHYNYVYYYNLPNMAIHLSRGSVKNVASVTYAQYKH
jgi:hypothetical protein